MKRRRIYVGRWKGREFYRTASSAFIRETIDYWAGKKREERAYWAAARDYERNWPEAAAWNRAIMTGDWTEYEERYGSPDDE